MKCPKCQHENEAGRSSARNARRRWPERAPSVVGNSLQRRSSAPSVRSRRIGTRTPPGHALRVAEDYTPKHLAEKILTSKSALEGERKQVTVLFADLKGSMELLADRDPEEARSSSTRSSSG